MNEIWRQLGHELADFDALALVTLRLTLSAVLGGVIGINREHAGQDAGWRTHILVTMGATLFVLAMAEANDATHDDVSRVIQGITTGIGFIGGGTILRLSQVGRIRGLATASSVWMTAGVGVAVGTGRIYLPIVATVAAWFVLAYLPLWESKMPGAPPDHDR